MLARDRLQLWQWVREGELPSPCPAGQKKSSQEPKSSGLSRSLALPGRAVCLSAWAVCLSVGLECSSDLRGAQGGTGALSCPPSSAGMGPPLTPSPPLPHGGPGGSLGTGGARGGGTAGARLAALSPPCCPSAAALKSLVHGLLLLLLLFVTMFHFVKCV